MSFNDFIKRIKAGLNWKYCLLLWIPIILLSTPLLFMLYTPKGIMHSIEWFTDFSWIWGGVSAGHGYTSGVIAGNVLRATIMFVRNYPE